MRIYIVVENYGQETQLDVKSFTKLEDATAWVRKTYKPKEIKHLRINITTEQNGKRSNQL